MLMVDDIRLKSRLLKDKELFFIYYLNITKLFLYLVI